MATSLHKPTRSALLFRVDQEQSEDLLDLAVSAPHKLAEVEVRTTYTALLHRVAKTARRRADAYVVAGRDVYRGKVEGLEASVWRPEATLTLSDVVPASKADLQLYREQETGRPATALRRTVALLELAPDAEPGHGYRVRVRRPGGSLATVVTVRAESSNEAKELALLQLEASGDAENLGEEPDLQVNVRQSR